MRIRAIFHVPFEKLGSIETWIQHHNHQLSSTHAYAGDKLPSPDDFDLLFVMGGPQSALDYQQHPFLKAEVALIQQAIAQNKYVVGICLGAQLLGLALGAEPERSPEREIGVYPVQLTPAAADDALFSLFPNEFDTMHWHSDMLGLAEDTVLLATSAGCPRQAFRYGQRAYGLQFHLELTQATTQALIAHCKEDLIPGPYVMSADALVKADFKAYNAKMTQLLDALIMQ